MITVADPNSLTAAEKAELGVTEEACVGDKWILYQGDKPPYIPTLEEVKTFATMEVDRQTAKNITAGFEFDSLLFSMSVEAQINWSDFPNLPSQVFPLTIMSKNDEEYILSESNKLNFYMSALAHKNQCLQVGNNKKKLIQACETVKQISEL